MINWWNLSPKGLEHLADVILLILITRSWFLFYNRCNLLVGSKWLEKILKTLLFGSSNGYAHVWAASVYWQLCGLSSVRHSKVRLCEHSVTPSVNDVKSIELTGHVNGMMLG